MSETEHGNNKDYQDIINKVVKRNENLAWRSVDGEVIIITPEDNSQHLLNEVGSTVWEFMDGKKTLSEIIGLMKMEYKENITKNIITEKQIENDVIEFVKELASEEKSIVILE